MSPLSEFLFLVISFTLTIVFYTNKQFQVLKPTKQINQKMSETKTKTKTIEKEKVFAETLNGRFAMIGLIAAIGAYLTTGQIIPGFV